MVQSGVILPEHLDIFDKGIAKRLDYSYSGPQAARSGWKPLHRPNTESTPTIVGATSFKGGLVIAQVAEVVDRVPRATFRAIKVTSWSRRALDDFRSMEGVRNWIVRA